MHLDKKRKKYEEQGVTVENELKRSHEYEVTSFRKHLPLQIWMYIITIIVTFLLVGYFLV